MDTICPTCGRRQGYDGHAYAPCTVTPCTVARGTVRVIIVGGPNAGTVLEATSSTNDVETARRYLLSLAVEVFGATGVEYQ